MMWRLALLVLAYSSPPTQTIPAPTCQQIYLWDADDCNCRRGERGLSDRCDPVCLSLAWSRYDRCADREPSSI